MPDATGPSAIDLKTRKVELLLQQLDNLPTLPAIATRLIALTSNNESAIREVIELITADPALTTKLLSLVQSAAGGVRRSITSVQQAVVLLGFEAVRNVVLSVKVFEAFELEPGEEKDPFNRAEFWKHSVAVATAAELLTAHANVRVAPQDAFVCGLLHDIGKIAFDCSMPKSFARAVEAAGLTRGDIADAERRIIGLDHAVAGKRLAEAWNLPQLIVQVIWLHGCAPLGLPAGIANPTLVRIVALADLLARRQHIGFSGNYAFPFDAAQFQEVLGISDTACQQVISQLAEQMEPRARALGLYDVQSRQVYLQSIANANRELGRLNQAITLQNRRLTARSDCFDMLTRLFQRMTPGASPAQLLTEMGAVASEYFHRPKLALFSQDPDDEAAGEVLLFDAANPSPESFLMPMPRWAGDQRVGRANASPEPLRPASPQLDWLLERVESFLQGRACNFFPLLCGQQPVGGLLWNKGEVAGPVAGPGDLLLVSQTWGMTLRMAQSRQRQNVLTEALAGSNQELAALQHQAVRARSLAHLGEMAAGAAHEMNNPLAVVCGRAQLLASSLPEGSQRQDAQQIAQQAQRLSQIITDMMEFARPEKPRPCSVSIIDIAQQAIAAATARLAPAEAPAIKLLAAPDLPPVVLDPAQITAAITEVILNALQAATATDRNNTGRVPVYVHVQHDSFGKQLIVQVIDHGPGMSEHTARQAFAPFFSAKTAGRQRGMGLSKALRWVELHGGAIRLDTAPNSGTTAVIILPLLGNEPAESAGAPAAAPAASPEVIPAAQATPSLSR